ncbi:type VI secretion system baseplate subunit TssF/IglH [Francisella frigiditurris]|uniref:Uncharacterized protein n=1 Tax=Francisella frigiditurris TaxID=1542390 RepID=A0A1J0KTC6_9GAMM|nr:type VI secretion system baseplate subunit TssF/IglH [Francisella frigiditurris]APC97032.1 hypothetical protein KX01_857 [Francisella frigiditurris]
MLKHHEKNMINNSAEKDLTTTEAIILKKAFDRIGEEIKEDFDNRISDYSNSLLFKYYSSFYYFLPKLYLLEIKDKGHNGYYISPQEYFFIEDKRNAKTLTYTTKSETVIAPISKIKTIKNNDIINVSLTFENHFEYDYLTLWLDPNLCDENPFFAVYLFNQILQSNKNDAFARIQFTNDTYTTKDITIEAVNLELKPTENIILNLHAPSCIYGFNVKIKDLFKYKSNTVEKIDLSFKILTDNYNQEKISSLFKVNLIPIFNSFYDYSHATFAAMNLSESKLRHPEIDDAYATDVISIYENNKPCDFNGYYFGGQNEYYFNCNKQALNYNIVFPQLDRNLYETKIHTYSAWSQLTKVSDLIEINSNAITSINCKISPLIIRNEIQNYNQNAYSIYNMIDMLVSGNIYTKTTFVAIARLLKTHDHYISLLVDLLQDLHLDTLTNELILTPSKRYNDEHKYFLQYFTEIICKFINQNTFSFVRKVILNTAGR